MRQRVSVIATVLNEAGTIETLLRSLAEQTRPPDEVVIVDGGSTDGTLERLTRFAASGALPLCVLSRPGCNISQGRNAAIGAAQGSIIVSTDAGVRLSKTWLEELVRPFEEGRDVDVVSGFFLPETWSWFELALAAVTLPRLGEIDPAKFWPSSRSVAFRRHAWEAVGGYPEWLDYCEDLLYDFSLRDAGFVFCFAPKAVAYFRPRPTLRAFFKQYYRYARGDGKADFWRYRHLVRYATYLGAVPLLLALSVLHHPAWLLALALGMAAMMRRPVRRLAPILPQLAPHIALQVLAWVPVQRWTGDIAKMLGYPSGVLWRRRYAPTQPWAKRQF
ncbi:MAG: glycosyltransferase [Chloroflexi bacterium]|nr:glycosyltransferase [Chloroflexota bacterium]